LATDLPDPLIDIAALYDRRMTVEEQFRDTKGCRFGVRLEWTPCWTPSYLARFTLVVGVALVLWTAVGQAVAHHAPRVRLPFQYKGPRLSLLRVGIQYVAKYFEGLTRSMRRDLPVVMENFQVLRPSRGRKPDTPRSPPLNRCV
jgi:hypothetical protein